MRAVILAAGRGSRLGDETEEKPKLFLTVGERTLYEHQVGALQQFCDEVTVVLGHGFEDADEADLHDQLAVEGGPDVDVVLFPEWKQYENAGSLHRALERFIAEGRADEDLLLVCGDVLFTEDTVRTLVDRFEADLREDGYNAVGYVPGIQDEMTGVLLDEDDVVTDYGAIESHQEVGLFVLNRRHVDTVHAILEGRRDEWFPIFLPVTPTKGVAVVEDERWEINTEEHLERARAPGSRWVNEAPTDAPSPELVDTLVSDAAEPSR